MTLSLLMTTNKRKVPSNLPASLLLLILTCLLAAATSASPVTKALHPRARIVGGSDAGMMIARRHVALHIYHAATGKRVLCGGTVIARRWVLTAAHCIYHPEFNTVATGISLYVGKQSLYEGDPVFASRIFVHASYNASRVGRVDTYRNDIAMIRTNRAMDNNNNNNDDHDHDANENLVGGGVEKVQLATFPGDEPDWIEEEGTIKEGGGGGGGGEGVMVLASGFGQTEYGGPLSNRLQKVWLKVMPFSDCEPAEPPPFRGLLDAPSAVCAVAPDFPLRGGRDTCNGDSGGPLYWLRPSDGALIQIGITSWASFGCAEKGSVAWYTRVRTFRRDIQALRSGWPRAATVWTAYP